MPNIGDVIIFDHPEESLIRQSTVELVPFPDKASEERALDAWANLLLPLVLQEIEAKSKQVEGR